MPYRPNHSRTSNESSQKQSPQTPKQSAQHGSILILPSESLAHVSATLDPGSLLALGQVNLRLRDHVRDDRTWAVAFKTQFLSLAVETDATQSDTLLLRRSEVTWRKEFIARWKLHRRFVTSKNATISHAPVNSNISSLLLLPDKQSMLCTSLTYGIVGRSFPFTGKMLKGYLDAHGALNGAGIGNPNAEFAPDVSVIELHSPGSGGSAKVAWGFLSGFVAVTAAPEVMVLSKTASFVRCKREDAHQGVVSRVTFGDAIKSSSSANFGATFASACSRGTVKLWESRRMRCLWTAAVYEREPSTELPSRSALARVPLAIKFLAYHSSAGVIAAGCANGDVCVWTGFDIDQAGLNSSTATLALEPPLYARIPSLEHDPNDATTWIDIEPSHIAIEPSAPGSAEVKLAVFYVGKPYFWRVTLHRSVGAQYQSISVAKFVTGSPAPLTARLINLIAVEDDDSRSRDAVRPPTTPSTSTPSLLSQTMGGLLPLLPKQRTMGSRPQSYIVAGDSAGHIFVWDWGKQGADAPVSSMKQPKSTSVPQISPSKRLVAHEDGAISSITLDGPVLATGSSQGSINIFDALTFRHLRTFAAPVVRIPVNAPLDADRVRVSNLVIRDDVLIASIGSRVYAWKAEIGRKDKNDKGKGKTSSRHRPNLSSRWHQNEEMRREVKQSKFEMDQETSAVQHVFGREREQRSTMAQMGLDEQEAVEYILMLSREEEAAKQRAILAAVTTTSANTHARSATSSTALVEEANHDLLFDMTDEFNDGLASGSPVTPRSRTQSSASLSSASSRGSSSPSASRHLTPPNASPRYGVYQPPSFSPTGSTKIQISPRPRPEVMEAGGLSTSPLELGLTGLSTPVGTSGSAGVERPNNWQIPSQLGTNQFPPVGSGPSQQGPATLTEWNTAPIAVSTIGSSRGGVPSATASPTPSVHSSVRSSTGPPSPSTSTSPGAPRSWSAVARMSLTSTSPTTPSSVLASTSTAPQHAAAQTSLASNVPATGQGASLLSASLARSPTTLAAVSQPPQFLSEDDELEYVLQLSLAEARSRGEDV